MDRVFIYLSFIYKPLTNRIKLGEGGIAVFNVTQTWFATHDIPKTVFSAVLSLLTLCALYGYNDYKDRNVDLLNPKKDHAFGRNIIAHPGHFLFLDFSLSVLLLVLCFICVGATQAASLTLLFIINIIYSNRWKAIAGLDLFIVIAWGGAFTLLSATINFKLAILAGLMTGIAHFFQMLLDIASDRKSNIKTTLVMHMEKAALVLIVLSVLLGAMLMLLTKSPLIAFSALLPVVFYFISSRVMVSWFLSRVYFFAVWVLMLNMIYGGV